MRVPAFYRCLNEKCVENKRFFRNNILNILQIKGADGNWIKHHCQSPNKSAYIAQMTFFA